MRGRPTPSGRWRDGPALHGCISPWCGCLTSMARASHGEHSLTPTTSRRGRSMRRSQASPNRSRNASFHAKTSKARRTAPIRRSAGICPYCLHPRSEERSAIVGPWSPRRSLPFSSSDAMVRESVSGVMPSRAAIAARGSGNDARPPPASADMRCARKRETRAPTLFNFRSTTWSTISRQCRQSSS